MLIGQLSLARWRDVAVFTRREALRRRCETKLHQRRLHGGVNRTPHHAAFGSRAPSTRLFSESAAPNNARYLGVIFRLEQKM